MPAVKALEEADGIRSPPPKGWMPMPRGTVRPHVGRRKTATDRVSQFLDAHVTPPPSGHHVIDAPIAPAERICLPHNPKAHSIELFPPCIRPPSWTI